MLFIYSLLIPAHVQTQQIPFYEYNVIMEWEKAINMQNTSYFKTNRKDQNSITRKV